MNTTAMAKKFKKVIAFAGVLLLPSQVAFAVSGGAPLSVSLENPLDRVNSIPELLVAILNIVITIAIPIIILFIIIAGFKYVTARGNAQQTQEATRALTYAVIGGVIIIGAVAITAIIQNVVDAF